MDLKALIRTVPDFPKKGVQFRDVTSLMENAAAFRETIARMTEAAEAHEPTLIAGIDARGFIFGGAMAEKLGLAFAPLRKAGKLPDVAIAEDYALEYGVATLEMHMSAAKAGDRVVIVDDLIATGGTALAAIKLVRRLGAAPACVSAVIDLPDLGGANKIREAGVAVHALMAFEGD